MVSASWFLFCMAAVSKSIVVVVDTGIVRSCQHIVAASGSPFMLAKAAICQDGRLT